VSNPGICSDGVPSTTSSSTTDPTEPSLPTEELAGEDLSVSLVLLAGVVAVILRLRRSAPAAGERTSPDGTEQPPS
jgi:hypothetical protein